MSRQLVRGRSLAAALFLTVTAGACSSDRAVAPGTTAVAVRASDLRGVADTTLATFTVRPEHGVVRTLSGGHQLVIYANAICDLSSTYGPTEWDKPCRLASSPVTITARTWTEANGHPRVDFRPRLRFAPSSRANAVLYLMDKVAVGDPAYRIFYCADDVSACVDESLTDPSVATQQDVRGFLYRRIKHFSGYNISTGLTVAPAVE